MPRAVRARGGLTRTTPAGTVLVLVVGFFEEATRGYPEFIRQQLPAGDKVAHVLLDDRPGAPAAAPCRSSGLTSSPPFRRA